LDYRRLTAQQVYDEVEAIAKDVQGRFGHLTSTQINWKARQDSWSIGQCLDHLIAINREYYPTFDRILRGEYGRSLLHRVPSLPAMYGRMMIQSLSPDSRRTFKAPSTAQPASSAIAADIVQRFVTHQRELVEKMRTLEAKDSSKTIITYPFARVIVYSLLDAFRLIVAHERRHLLQAQRVASAVGFPGAAEERRP
jgi:hypothetical protein